VCVIMTIQCSCAWG